MSPPLLPFRTALPRIAPDTEWVFARFRMPYDLWIDDDAVRLEVVLCVELPRGVLLTAELLDSVNPVSLADVLRKAIERPMEGKPRRPARVRVQNARIVAELRGVMGDDVAVVAGPTPEADEAFEALAEAMRPRSAPSYLAGGAPPDLIDRLFNTSSAFCWLAPWKEVVEEQIVRVDIPSLEVHGACLTIIGQMGQSRGLLLFPSAVEFERFAEAGMEAAGGREARAPVELLSLSFERKRDMPPPLLRQIEQHQWPVSDKNGYPMVLAIGPDGLPRATTERDVRILNAVAWAFLAFFARNREMFAGRPAMSLSESFAGDDEIEVMITAPYLDDAEMARPAKPRARKQKRPRKRKK